MECQDSQRNEDDVKNYERKYGYAQFIERLPAHQRAAQTYERIGQRQEIGKDLRNQGKRVMGK